MRSMSAVPPPRRSFPMVDTPSERVLPSAKIDVPVLDWPGDDGSSSQNCDFEAVDCGSSAARWTNGGEAGRVEQ